LPAAQPKGNAQGVLLWTWQPLEPVEHRQAQLLKRREGELHLRLDADGSQDAKVWRRADRVVHERRLAHSGLAAEHEGLAFTPAHSVE
jgi:hypothetical protein